VFDEVAIKTSLSYDKVRDEMESLEELGSAIDTRGSFATSALLYFSALQDDVLAYFQCYVCIWNKSCWIKAGVFE